MNSFKIIMIAALMLFGASLMLFGASSAYAQTAETAPPTEKDIAKEIEDTANSLVPELESLGSVLQNLPNDMAAVKEHYGRMIAAANKVVALLDENSSIAKNIGVLKSQAQAERDKWRQKCSTTNKPADCDRIEAWETKLERSVDVEQELARVFRDATKELTRLMVNEEYVIDDMKLQKFEAALSRMQGALKKVDGMVAKMRELGPKVEGRDTQG